jgi:DDE_Tnp_1-associated
LRQQQRDAGLIPHPTSSPSHSTSPFADLEEEGEARSAAVSALLLLMRQLLPVLLRRFAKIADPRNPNTLKHRLTVLMVYGSLVFVFQYASRRAANAEITRPMFERNPRRLFPQLDTLPHADTLFRLPCRIEVGAIEQAHIELVNYHSLAHAQQANTLQRDGGERRQHFQWVNAIRYEYGPNAKKAIELPVVVCREQWQALDPDTLAIVTKHSKHAWLSNRPLSRLNVQARCTLGARYRWGIEGAFLVEKHQGYAYEHAFAKHWNAMKGYHYLMRLAHLFNTLARFSKELAELFTTLGVQATIGFIRNTLTGPWLDAQDIQRRLSRPFRLRLI